MRHWTGKPPMHFEIYPEANTDWHGKDQWRWRLKTANGKIIADSAEAYNGFSNARRAVNRLVDMMIDWAASANLEIRKVDH